MLAVAGYLAVEAGWRLPGTIDLAGTKFEDIPNGFAALSAIPAAGCWQIIAFIGYLEVAVMKGKLLSWVLVFSWKRNSNA